ncbi:hypothetical protein FIBSPDRAFT_273509 [Athelia psychrophila]|uniref:Uncharacterized protein n=1 Tax=Athelia psychrophila TaxID=1759441 RepID=A0A166R8S1_9AGAM|nr:hypothetical protein FIBSPDRAFT_273509 [Fibularhizoctonia sp. CBS 109695]
MGSSSTIPSAPATSASPIPAGNDTDMTPPEGADGAPPLISPPPSGPLQTPAPAPAPAHPSLPPKPAPPPITSFHLPSHHHHSSAPASSSSSSNLNANGKRPRPRNVLPTLSQLQHTRLPGQAAPGFAASLAGSYTAAPPPTLGTPKETVAAGVSPAHTNAISPPPGASSRAATGTTTTTTTPTPRLGAPLVAGKAPTPASTTGRPKPVGRGSLAGVKIVKAKKKEKEGATVAS